ncbi:hypothetical protein A7985_02900 [Pseudoalteromonas luteoviolacea]|uniref:Uncharacterized protein n=1 Tax=Pseudoalteromonas luteoviolacea TaxID=43657 RepID=A0A1C0TUD0_9GAMM|nr:hypothetical protein [Pseudoalteromonas luteoviolacea]OCQ22923.1 hypothetical protein A7985_02900 [Pseudoalteromonas luteoviolacea]
MSKVYKPALLAGCLILAGCGGSSDRASENKPSISAGEEQPKLTFNVKTRTDCGTIPYPNASVVFHDTDGNVLATHKTDSVGFFSQDIPAGALHASVIGVEDYGYNRLGTGDKGKIRKIHTALDISEGAQLETIEFFDASGSCPCRDITVDLSELAVTHSDYKVSREDGVGFDGYKGSVSVCGHNPKLYYSISLSGYDMSKLAVIDVPAASSSVVITESDFVHDSVRVPTAHLADKSKVSVNGRDSYGEKILSNFDDAGEHTVFKIYPSLSNINELFNYKSTVSYPEELPVIHSWGVITHLDNEGKTNEFVLPEAQFELASELTKAVLMQEQGDVYAYNFEGFDTRLQEATVIFNFELLGSPYKKLKWIVAGGLNSEIPKLTFGEEFKVSKRNVTPHASLHLSGYHGAPTSLVDYRQYVQQHIGKTSIGDQVFIRTTQSLSVN